jgi:hypothetical protein
MGYSRVMDMALRGIVVQRDSEVGQEEGQPASVFLKAG